MIEPAWHFLPGRLPRRGNPVLVVKGKNRNAIVREAVYQGHGYWKGFGDAPVVAWRPLPHSPISIRLQKVLDERARLLGYPRSSKQEKRLMQLEVQIELAQRARESEYERFIREAALALRIVGNGTLLENRI